MSLTWSGCAKRWKGVSTRVRGSIHCPTVASAWNGLDTLIVTAGVSALQPLMSVAGVEMSTPDIVGSQASPEGIQHAVNAANAAVNGNYIGPFIAAVAFVSAVLVVLLFFAN